MELFYRRLARLVASLKAAQVHDNVNQTVIDRLDEQIADLCALLPSGSGIDRGTTLDLERSSDQRLVFEFGFHHMDENGSYDGWTEHRAVLKACLIFGTDLKISGPNRNCIKDYLHDTFHHVLTSKVWEDTDRKLHTSLYESAPE